MSMLSDPLIDVKPGSATSLVERCCVRIDQDLVALAESMRVLRSRRNGLARISCLPLDILVTIFRHFESFENHTSTSRHRGAPICLILTHVCKQWRQLALDCPTLWIYISCVSPRWLGVMLERSKDAHLVATYHAPVSLRGCLEPVLSHLPRIKVLRICSVSPDVDRIVELLSSQPALSLQIFEFTVIGTVHHSLMPISDTLFRGQVPLLQSVELVLCSLSWTWSIFSGLRSLSVRGTTGALPTPAQLLSTLRYMPDLEQLTLQSLPTTFWDTGLCDKVPLTRLKSMALDIGAAQTVVSLFECLVLPAGVKVALYISQIEGSQSFSDLFSAMDRASDGPSPVVRSLRAIRISNNGFVVQFNTSMAFKSHHYHSWNPADDDIPLSIQFTCNPLAHVQPTIIFELCRVASQGRIHSMFLELLYDLPELFWRTGSAGLLDLHVIRISRNSIRGLIDALSIDDIQASVVAYPSLRVLELEGINFGDHEAEDLQHAIKQRAECGAHIHKLRLAGCIKNLTVDQVRLLEEAGVNVDWDRHDEETCADPGRHGYAPGRLF
ncbi:hypothetical protein DFJ58DRAFT_698882 [Suillus subalutaceus]|uniref:uncharacterized protein n=1 Tax=Suillus subalutaceus TaxID=48586 RepID=UPI001B8644B4|nr:uncharacterized protein DFJ58DRAFT_698882 [Suillus subalutaceus]KAG1866652.1 hypothetical protein DFJ58DRAFT_698882 [Suillus subalutaceus]